MDKELKVLEVEYIETTNYTGYYEFGADKCTMFEIGATLGMIFPKDFILKIESILVAEEIDGDWLTEGIEEDVLKHENGEMNIKVKNGKNGGMTGAEVLFIVKNRDEREELNIKILK